MKLNKLFIVGLSSVLLTAVATAEEGKEKGKGKGKGQRPAPRAFEEVDTDKDGKISLVEFTTGAKDAKRAEAMFGKKDKDADGFLTTEEYAREKGKRGPKKERKEKKDK